MNGPDRPLALDQPRERAVVLSALSPSAVPIFQFSQEVPVGLGTGTLFQVGDAGFLVTAAHVIRDLRRGGTIRLLDGEVAFTPRWRGTSNLDHDIAVLRLNEEDFERIGARHTVLGLGNVWAFRSTPYDEFFLSGFPSDAQSVLRGSATLRTAVALCFRYLGTPPGFLEGARLVRRFDAKLEILLHHQEGLGPWVAGMSGSSLWCRTEGSIPGAFRVLGVQTSGLRGRWVRATLWSAVARVFHATWPELRPLFVDHFGALAATS